MRGLAAAQTLAFLDRADALAAGASPRVPPGAVCLTLFFEASTRTRVSFEIAAKRLGLDVTSLTIAASSAQKGETLRDTAENLLAMRRGAPTVIVVRHAQSGAPARLAAAIDGRARVANAGDGLHEHPTQALLDCLALRRRFGTIAKLEIAIVGDLLHSRVARSDLFAMTALGANVRLCAPATLLPPGLAALGAAMVTTDIDEAIAGADAVIALRMQRERMAQGLVPSLSAYHRDYGITNARLARAKPEAVVMHPGPMNRGVEIDSEVADGPRSIILDQVQAGVDARMAALEWLLEETA